MATTKERLDMLELRVDFLIELAQLPDLSDVAPNDAQLSELKAKIEQLKSKP